MKTASIDVVVPAYNEEAVIEASVRELEDTLSAFPLPHRIVVADNGSTDATAACARRAGAEVLAVPVRGKGAALRYAARASEAPLFAFIDADLSAHPRELAHFYAVMRERGADLVIGSRLIAREGVNRSALRTFSSLVFNLLRRLILGISVADTQCGLKLMNERGRNILRECEETGWFVDMELLAKAERAGLVIIELPVAWEEFRYKGRVAKLNVIRDGIGAISAMMRIRDRLVR